MSSLYQRLDVRATGSETSAAVGSRRDEVITYDDVVLPHGRLSDQFRREQPPLPRFAPNLSGVPRSSEFR